MYVRWFSLLTVLRWYTDRDSHGSSKRRLGARNSADGSRQRSTERRRMLQHLCPSFFVPTIINTTILTTPINYSPNHITSFPMILLASSRLPPLAAARVLLPHVSSSTPLSTLHLYRSLSSTPLQLGAALDHPHPQPQRLHQTDSSPTSSSAISQAPQTTDRHPGPILGGEGKHFEGKSDVLLYGAA
jgi:hypothetical protein